MPTDTFTHTLQYAGRNPFVPESDSLDHRLYEQLRQDEGYIKIAQVRYLLEKLHDETENIDDQYMSKLTFEMVGWRDSNIHILMKQYITRFVVASDQFEIGDHWEDIHGHTTEVTE